MDCRESRRMTAIDPSSLPGPPAGSEQERLMLTFARVAYISCPGRISIFSAVGALNQRRSDTGVLLPVRMVRREMPAARLLFSIMNEASPFRTFFAAVSREEMYSLTTVLSLGMLVRTRTFNCPAPESATNMV